MPPRGGPCAAERRPLCREEALCAGRYSVLRGLEEAPVSGGGSLCRMVLLLYAEGIEGPLCREEALVPLRGGPVPPRGGPCTAERRPLCREEALCAGRSSVLRGLEEAPVSGGGSLCRMVLLPYAEGIEGGPCVGRRLLCREEALCAGRSCPLC